MDRNPVLSQEKETLSSSISKQEVKSWTFSGRMNIQEGTEK